MCCFNIWLYHKLDLKQNRVYSLGKQNNETMLASTLNNQVVLIQEINMN